MVWFEFRYSATMGLPGSLDVASIHPTASSAASFPPGSGASQPSGRNAPLIFLKTAPTSVSDHREKHRLVSDASADPYHLPWLPITPFSTWSRPLLWLAGRPCADFAVEKDINLPSPGREKRSVCLSFHGKQLVGPAS